MLRGQFPKADITTDQFVDALQEALAAGGALPATAIILDEVQQYIGEDTNRSYIVQEVVEACSKRFGDRLLFVGTGQTALSGTAALHRLQGRFAVNVELSDADVETVIRRVVLAKRQDRVAAVRAALSGEIDGFVGPRSPRCFDEGHPKVARLFRDSMAVAEDYYRRTKIFPIMHVLGVRRSLADAHPWLPGALLKGFSAAKVLAEDALNDTSATKVTMPFVEDTLTRARGIMGAGLWTYGVGANAHVLEAFLEQHHDQGLSPRRVALDELFHPATVESYSL